MKKNKLFLISNVLLTVFAASACTNTNTKSAVVQNKAVLQNKNVTKLVSQIHKYKDGVYNVKTDPDGETYYSKAEISIHNSKITNVVFNIYDGYGRVFDKTYEKVFDNELYKQQCRDDFKGLQIYIPELIKTQDISKVDAVSGATWAYGKFSEAITLGLKKAK